MFGIIGIVGPVWIYTCWGCLGYLGFLGYHVLVRRTSQILPEKFKHKMIDIKNKLPLRTLTSIVVGGVAGHRDITCTVSELGLDLY